MRSNYREIEKHIANMENFEGNSLEGIFGDYGDVKHYSVWSYGRMEILYIRITQDEAIVWMNGAYRSKTTSRHQNLTFKAIAPIVEELKNRGDGFTVAVQDRARDGRETNTVFCGGMSLETVR